MRLGLYLRNMGPTSTREMIDDCARGADEAGVDDLWLADHIAIPPDDAEGSGGRYLDPLATLAWLSARTERISLGTGVLVLPYRPALPTAKWIATIQELSGGVFQHWNVSPLALRIESQIAAPVSGTRHSFHQLNEVAAEIPETPSSR